MSNTITNILISWYLKYKRDLPWRDTRDPYKIWISEIILQQTRVSQGISYYYRFLESFPDIKTLAGAKEEDVLKNWQGLGYYSRARNLHATARLLSAKYNNSFPENFDEIKALKGIGDYTAAAIGSFAFGIRYPVLDGNVFRFITRYFGIDTPIHMSETRKNILNILHEMMSEVKDPALFNQALMEFGALQCVPKNPACDVCPLRTGCHALGHSMVDKLPVKQKAAPLKKRYLHYFILNYRNACFYMQRRHARDIWQGLHEFPLIETAKPVSFSRLQSMALKEPWGASLGELQCEVSDEIIHKLSHQELHVRFYTSMLKKRLKIKNSVIFEVKTADLENYAIPRVIDRFLIQQGYFN